MATNFFIEELDEQLRNRTQTDDKLFKGAMHGLCGALTGKRLTLDAVYGQDVNGAKDAVNAICMYYGVNDYKLPETITDLHAQLEYILRPRGYMWREVNLIGDWPRDCVGALLGSTKDGTPVALLPRSFGGYDIYDPRVGEKRRLTKALRQELAPEALSFYRPFPNRALKTRDLIRFIAGALSAADYLLLALSTLAVTLVGLLPAYANSVLFGNVVGVDAGLLPAALCVLLGATLSTALMGAVKTLSTTRVKTKLNATVEAASMSRVLSLPIMFFNEYNAGDVATRVGNIKSLCASLADAVLTTGFTSLLSLIYIGQIFSLSPGMTAPALIVMLATVLLSVVSSISQMKHTKRLMLMRTKISGLQFALVSGVQKLKLSCAEKRGFAKWASAYQDEVRQKYNPPALIKLSSVLSLGISLAGMMLMYYSAARTGLTGGEYIAFNVSYGMVSGAFLALAGMTNTIAGMRPMLEMVKPLLEAVPEAREDKEVITRLSGGIELNNVTFRYNEDQPYLLDNISLKISPGQYVAIVGRTGCGKSTLMKLLLGFGTPERGSVYFDGKDLRSLDAPSLRRHIGVVSQDGKLFSGNMYSNIVISAPQLTMDEAWQAAELAGIADDIRQMPMGMFTMISEDSGGVSGGQRQRIMIARAIAPKPRILMFDEATSALDNITQKKVSDSLDSLKCTRLVIAHRLSTIRHCDRIIVLEGGKIVEDGTYDELLAKGGDFAELVARQRLDDDAFIGKTTLY